MGMKWRLREFVRERGMVRASQIRRTIEERTGYVLTEQAVCDLLNRPPRMLRVETMNAICKAFYCKLSDFCELIPDSASKPEVKIQTMVREQKSHEHQHNGSVDFAAFFPDARKYSNSDQLVSESTNGV
jgi:DNA-binding Xre family transcriptional regulator